MMKYPEARSRSTQLNELMYAVEMYDRRDYHPFRATTRNPERTEIHSDFGIG